MFMTGASVSRCSALPAIEAALLVRHASPPPLMLLLTTPSSTVLSACKHSLEPSIPAPRAILRTAAPYHPTPPPCRLLCLRAVPPITCAPHPIPVRLLLPLCLRRRRPTPSRSIRKSTSPHAALHYTARPFGILRSSGSGHQSPMRGVLRV
ncbi:hypothetical protein HYPSUDRAFT_524079 [Hypholoma sublateritium FD-334 SS-4]|uniref:Uncharacterized protein n=1 Tax=Hypholoma sublateritium (strain FD-334 SS-4) TaxID=945553 RepID=A0A0D2PFH0_HYPSF|nr:hypothetical protein HYPSUDRAFT_524079 [Hypholoma sublateritium FD-334 SS-4]